MNKIINFPKIKSPFVRKRIRGRYLVTPEIEEGYEWVFEDSGVMAVDKLHGTNLCVIVKDGALQSIDNRDTRVVSSPAISTKMNPHESRMVQGIIKAIEKGHIKEDGRVYGELIGPTINGNLHGVSFPTFVPFYYLLAKCHWRSWVKNEYPKDFDSISAWFRELPSLYSQRCGEPGGAEGLVFYHPDRRRLAKLRRDMFEWYE